MGKVYSSDGSVIDFDFAVSIMDDFIRERLHMFLAPCTEQEFFTAYEKEHEKKYHEKFDI